ncbi:MAG: hypothetical protein BroJett013_23680 [Alphaproteobacteria bacterium]|nr:MAG: hypothetical protein BroJett013_23680 [Alphaproteobacteria bacterium]
MQTHVDPTQAEKLRALAATLRRAYSGAPAQVPDTMMERLRRLEERERGQTAPPPR